MASQFNPNIIYADLPKVPSLAKTHGILMGLTFAVILPLGALLIRIPNVKYGVWIHAGWQLIGWACMIAGMVMGIRMGNILDRVSYEQLLCNMYFSYDMVLMLTFGIAAQQCTHHSGHHHRRCAIDPAFPWVYPPPTVYENPTKGHMDAHSCVLRTGAADLGNNKRWFGIAACF